MTLARIAVGILFLAGGCATQADLQRVERDVNQVQANVADMRLAVRRMEREMDILKERGGAAGGGSKQLDDIKRRLLRVERRAGLSGTYAPGGSGTVSIGPSTDARPPTAGSVPGSEAAQIALRHEEPELAGSPDTYRTALELYRQGSWERAIAKMREFLQANPKSELADNAQYWIGESYYNQRDYNRAIIELNEVLLKYPKGDRVPGALLALATAFADSGDPIDARLILQKLISDHPNSEEAQIGRRKLAALSE